MVRAMVVATENEPGVSKATQAIHIEPETLE